MNLPHQTCDPDHPATWVRFRKQLCRSCRATCCSLPVEVRLEDLVRMELIHPLETAEPPKVIARRLQKARLVEHFNFKNTLFTLARRASGDCHFLDPDSRLCTIYERRPDTCRNHPQVGPRPGFCAFGRKAG